MLSVPARLTLDGESWEVARAWPDGDRVAVELTGPRGIRAGWIGASGPHIQPVGADPRLQPLAHLARDHQVISHRPGRRAVVRSADGSRFVKVVRAGKAEAILRGIQLATAFAGPFRTPQVLAADAHSVTFAALPGVSLHHAAGFEPVTWALAWESVLQAWETGARAPASLTRCHDAAAEAGVLHQWAGRSALVLAAAPARAAIDLASAAAEALLALPDVRQVPTHRDLHDKQVLWDPELGPALLDVDTAAAADPALDLGNLRAHAHWRERQGLWKADAAEVVAAAVDRAAERIAVPRSALAAYELSALTRLSLVYAFRPRWAARAADLRAALHSSLSG